MFAPSLIRLSRRTVMLILTILGLFIGVSLPIRAAANGDHSLRQTTSPAKLHGLTTLTGTLTISGTIEPPVPAPQYVAEGGYIPEPIGDNLGPAEYQEIWEAVQQNLHRLQAAGVVVSPSAAQTVFYSWPVRLAPGLTDYAGHYVSAFPDHDSGSGILDYNNGSRTYNGHRGTDIALWPFNWNKVDADEVQVIAAADGTIINKVNVDPTDHNCNVSSSDPWNYVVLSHADGRITIYGHMKYNSLTAKSVGQTVVRGEYLGIVASSGNSSGPHVHFEVCTSAYVACSSSWTDPSVGPANPLVSGWLSQRPYRDSAINKIATGPAGPVFNACTPSIPNIQTSFTFTQPTSIYFQVYYRDYQNSLPTQLV